MAKVQIVITNILWKSEFFFPVAMWFCSRIFIWTAMLLIAPHLPSPTDNMPRWGWELFDGWDSVHYRAIATRGYEFVDDGKQHNIAFFPLFPLIIWFLLRLGLPFEMAGILVNNLAFLGAIYCLYFWAKEHYGSG